MTPDFFRCRVLDGGMAFAKLRVGAAAALVLLLASTGTWAAETVPTDVQMPGTQPEDGINVESVSKCDNCHGNFVSPSTPLEEPWFNWAGSMMAHASRDPIFWATMAVGDGTTEKMNCRIIYRFSARSKLVQKIWCKNKNMRLGDQDRYSRQGRQDHRVLE